VARVVAARALGSQVGEDPVVRSKVAEAFADEISQWIDHSGGDDGHAGSGRTWCTTSWWRWASRL
jgi:hypothetical protein